MIWLTSEPTVILINKNLWSTYYVPNYYNSFRICNTKIKKKKKHNLAENKRYSCSQDAYCLFRETTKSKYDKCLIRNCQEEKSSEVC